MNRMMDYFRRGIRNKVLHRMLSLLLAVVLITSTLTPSVVFGDGDIAAGVESTSEIMPEDAENGVSSSSTEVTDSGSVISESNVAQTDQAATEPVENQTEVTESDPDIDGAEAEDPVAADATEGIVEASQEDLILTDEAFGVTVTIPYESMPEGLTRDEVALTVRSLTARELEEFSDEVQAATSMIQWAYDITLVHKESGDELQPSGAVTVTVGEYHDDEVSVVRIEDEGGYTELEAEADGVDTAFETEHFSRYGGVVFGGALAYFGWKYDGTSQFMFSWKYEEEKYATAFCIQVDKIFKTESGYEIYYEVGAKDLNDFSTHQTTVSEEDFKKLKRMLYLYETEYKDLSNKTSAELDALNFSLDVYWGNVNDSGTVQSQNRLNLGAGYGGSTGLGGREATELKHWAMFQAILHRCLRLGFTKENVENGRRYFTGAYTNDTGNNSGKEFRQKYWRAAIDESKDAEIDQKYEFLIGVKEGNQNAIIIKEKDGRISTTVNAAGMNSTSEIALPLSIEDLTKSDDGSKILVPVKDTVYYYELKNTRYNITGHLYKVNANGTVDESAPVKTVTRTNVALSGDGSIEMDFDTVKLDPNERYVVYETVETVDTSADNYQKFEHKQSDDNTQSFAISEITTTISANDNAATSESPVSVKATDAENGVRVVDTVKYENLPVGKTYNIRAELYEVQYNESTGSYEISGSPVATESVNNYTISSKNGTASVDFGILTNLEEGKRYVCYQTMTSVDNMIDSDRNGSLDTKHVVTHKDANDNAQTVRISEDDETEFSVGKTWDESLTKVPVTVRLLDNGEPVYIDGKIAEVELNAENYWYYKWEGLPKNGHNYTAVEVLEGDEGFVAEYQGLGTHTYVKAYWKDTTTQETTTTKVTTWREASSFNAGDQIVLVADSVSNVGNYSGINVVGQALSYNESGTNSGVRKLGWESGPSTDSKGDLIASTITDTMTWTLVDAGDGKFKIRNKALGRLLYFDSPSVVLGGTLDNLTFSIENGYLYASSSYGNNGYMSYASYRSNILYYLTSGGSTTHFKIYKYGTFEETTTITVPGEQVLVEEPVSVENTYIINNMPKPPVTTTTLAVKKNWGEGLTPVPIAVQLYRNGEHFSTVWLNSDNNWSYVWEGLEGERSEYEVREVLAENAPFTASYLTEDNGSITIPVFTYNIWEKSGYTPGTEITALSTGSEIVLVTSDGHAMMQTNASGNPSTPWSQVRLTSSAVVNSEAISLNQPELSYSVWKVEVDTATNPNTVLLYTGADNSRQYITGTGVLSATTDRNAATRFMMGADGTFQVYGGNGSKLGVSSDGRFGFGSGTALSFTPYCHMTGEMTEVNYEGEIRVITNTRKEVPSYELPSTGGFGSSGFSSIAIMLFSICAVVGTTTVIRIRRRRTVKIRKR